MKNILVIDGGPRRNMNTAALCDAFAEGAKAVSPEIATEHVRLRDIAFKGCASCLACKLKNSRFTKVCAWKDGLTPVLSKAAEADGLAFASPIYFGEITAELRSFLERLLFPWLSYDDGSCNAPRRVPTAFLYTMNGGPEHAAYMRPNQEANERLVAMFLQPPERVEAFRTVQVADYSRYAMAMLDPDAHLAWRAAHWESDLAAAHAAGRRMAEKALAGG
jgi:multimeric flavodoxin WrbA